MRLAVLRQAASGKAGKDQEHVLALLEPLLEDKDDWPRLTAEAVKDPSTPYDVEAVLQASAAGKDMLKRLEEALEAAHESLGGLRPAVGVHWSCGGGSRIRLRGCPPGARAPAARPLA